MVEAKGFEPFGGQNNIMISGSKKAIFNDFK
jgi:hypothetical protein